jgi:hypothetical protein
MNIRKQNKTEEKNHFFSFGDLQNLFAGVILEQNEDVEVLLMNKCYYSFYRFTGFAFSKRSREFCAVDFH